MTHNSPQGRLKCYLTTPIVELSLETAHRYLHTFIDKLCKVPLSYICTLILYHSKFFTATGFLYFSFFMLVLFLFNQFCNISNFSLFLYLRLHFFPVSISFLSISFLFGNYSYFLLSCLFPRSSF